MAEQPCLCCAGWIALAKRRLVNEEGGLAVGSAAAKLSCGQILDQRGWSRAGLLTGQNLGQSPGRRTCSPVGLLHCLGEADIVVRVSPAAQFGGGYGHGRDS
jgi:hypothetical protein